MRFIRHIFPQVIFNAKFLWIITCLLLLTFILLIASKHSDAITDTPLNSFLIKKQPINDFGEKNRPHQVIIKVQSGDTFGALMIQQGLEYNQVHQLLEHPDAQTWLVHNLRVGRELIVVVDRTSTRLQSLELQIDLNTSFLAKWNSQSDDFDVAVQEKITDREQIYIEGTIQNSLSVDATASGMPTKVIVAFANIFAWDIDFAYDIRSGDRFRVLYEEHFIDGKKIPMYSILAAELTVQGTTITAIGHTPSHQKDTSYYALNGTPIQKPFLRMPVNFGRISSHFNLKRVHPLFKTVRPHRGTDYAAPRHTPIHSVARGTILFRGKKKGYGNTVIVRHDHGITTLYAHMHNFVRGHKRNSHVSQGEVIGYVGTTGYSTGPHVHFEFKVHGKHENPATVSLPNSSPMSAEQIVQYEPIRDQILKAFNIHQSVLALNDG